MVSISKISQRLQQAFLQDATQLLLYLSGLRITLSPTLNIGVSSLTRLREAGRQATSPKPESFTEPLSFTKTTS